MLIAEELVLLAYHDEKGTADAWIDNIDYRLAGAILIELAQMGRIEPAKEAQVTLEGTSVKQGRVVATGFGSAGHPELDKALATIAQKQRRPTQLVPVLAKGLRQRLLEGLAQSGVLRREESKALGVISVTRWPTQQGSHEAALRARLRAVLLEGALPGPAEAALLALSEGSGLVKRLVPKENRKQATARAKEVATSDWASGATKKAIAELTTAILVAVIIPAATAAGQH